MGRSGEFYKRLIRRLAKKNGQLKRKVDFLEAERIKQEKLADNRRMLLRRINEEYALVQRQLQQKNEELQEYISRLASSQDQLSGVLRHSPCCISLKSPEGVYILCNPQLERLLGVAEGASRGKSIWDLFNETDARQIDSMDREALRTRKPVTRELRFTTGGVERIMNLTVFPLNSNQGPPQALGGVAIDMSDLRRMESETLHAAQLASIGELAAGVAHEINNPVNGIMNYAQLIADECEETGRDPDFPLRIIQECERIAGIVRSLLDLARRPTDERRPCSLATIMDNALKLMRSQLLHENVELDTMLQADLPPVYGNALELQQVFMNCISNARKAMRQRNSTNSQPKRLRIQLKVMRLEGGTILRTSFEDNGHGISPHDMQRIFEPFFTTNASGQGTGLGLSICKRIITEHGGRIHVESQEGAFTRVMVDLPPHDTSPADGRQDTAAPAAGATK